MDLCDKPNLLELLDAALQSYVNIAEKKRFSNESKTAFAMIKKLTKYDKFQKREGSFISEVDMNGVVMGGDMAEQAIMEDFKAINRLAPEQMNAC